MAKYILMLIVSMIFWSNLNAQVPRKIVYQGRLLDHDTLRPISGNFTKNFLVLIRKQSNPDQASTPLLSRSINDVVINDGLFTLSIDVESVGNEPVLTFDEPYFLEVIMGDQSSGGRVGQKVLFSTPYAMGSQNVLNLNGNQPSAFVLGSHGHSTPGTSSFLIDGSNQTFNGSELQFVISNDEGQVFTVDENAELNSLRNIRASTDVVTNDKFVTGYDLDDNSFRQVLIISQQGDLTVDDKVFKGTLTVNGRVNTKSLCDDQELKTDNPNLCNSFQFKNLLISPANSVGFSVGATIVQQALSNTIGNSHTIEDHVFADNSQLKAELETLTSGGVISGYHSHIFVNKEFNSFVENDFIRSELIRNGELINSKFSNDENSLIEDIKLATISSPGKISLSAVPSQVALTNQDNDFTRAFPLTRLNFDKFKSKTLTIASSVDDRIDGAFPLLSFKNRDTSQDDSDFSYVIKSNGDFVFSREITPISSFAFETPGNRGVTFFRTQNVRFAGINYSPPDAVDESFFDGSVIANSSITGADLADSAITNLKIKDLSVLNEHLSSNAITTSKLFGDITSRPMNNGAITTDKIKDFEIETSSFGANSIETSDFKDNELATINFAASSITDQKFATGAITELELEDNLGASVFSENAFTSDKITTGADKITNAKLSVEVLANRSEPIKITTDSVEIIQLKNVKDAILIRGVLDSLVANSDFSAGLEITNDTSVRIVSMNHNGTISLSSDASITNAINVTLTPKFTATLVGATDASGNCGNLDPKMSVLTRGSISDCISTELNHGIAELTHENAANVCRSNGYELCDMNQYYNACRKGMLLLNEESLGGQFLTTNMVPLFKVSANNCSSVGDFSIDQAHRTNDAKNFRCCLK